MNARFLSLGRMGNRRQRLKKASFPSISFRGKRKALLLLHNIVMFTVHFSNKFECLLDQLLHAAMSPSPSPFDAVEIIVPSAAMQRRLELSMAQTYGVCAHVRFAYLGQWVWEQMGQRWPVPETSPFAPETLAWRILPILENPSFHTLHTRLRSWIANADPVMRYELAKEVALALDQIITYRPNLIEAWSSNKLLCMPGGTRTTAQDQQWQAELWRRLLHETGSDRHLPAMAKKLASLAASTFSGKKATQVTHVFCPPTIAPLTIDILNRFSQWMDVRLYVLNPCREYWFDIVDRKRLAYLASQGQAAHHETGNRLLASWGQQTQAMIDLLFEKTDLACEEVHHFISNAENGKTSLLAQVQDAILNLQELPTHGIKLEKDDRSIEVHVCHSLTRELEVLQDQLLALFVSDTTLAPEDVLVVTPHLKEAAPLIDAVFGTASPARQIPYTLTGLGDTRTNPVAVALLDLMSLAFSRFTASAVFKLLQQPVIAQSVDLDEAQLDMIHEWMSTAGIRWGLHAAHRRDLALPDSEAYSFKDGLHRLFLSYALPDDSAMPFAGRLPCGSIEGTEALTLGRFYGFVEKLDALQVKLRQARIPEAWRDTLFDVLETFITPAGNQIDDLTQLRERIQALCTHMEKGAKAYSVHPQVMLQALKETLDDPARGGVPTGTVTFTAMNSLRNLPYRVICVIGMNDGAFPSIQHAPEFDLIAHAPQRGDRQRRLDERNLFLDLLLAAQDRFYLSYTGRSIRDNSTMPPSVLIADLLDCLKQAIGDDIHELIIEHPLQAFAIDYFRNHADARMASSNGEYFHALAQQAQAAAAQSASLHPKQTRDADQAENDDESFNDDDASADALYVTPFFSAPLPAPEENWRHLSLDQLLRFFNHPSRYLLQQRLGMRFPQAEEELADDEPFLPERHARRAFNDRLLPLLLTETPLETLGDIALASHEFPPGTLGNRLMEEALRDMQDFAQKIKPGFAAPCLPPQTHRLPFSLDEEHWTLTHSFTDLRPDGWLGYRYENVRARDYLNGWITHLYLNATQPENAGRQTIWHGKDKSYALRPVPQAEALAVLQTLLTLYRKGLQVPLHFYPRTAWDYVSRGLNKAKNTWQGGHPQAFSESQDLHYQQALRAHSNPLDAEFEATAQAVFGTLPDYLDDLTQEVAP